MWRENEKDDECLCDRLVALLSKRDRRKIRRLKKPPSKGKVVIHKGRGE